MFMKILDSHTNLAPKKNNDSNIKILKEIIGLGWNGNNENKVNE